MTPNVQYQWPQKKYLRLTTTFYTTQKDQNEFKALLNRINLTLSHKTHLYDLCKTWSNKKSERNASVSLFAIRNVLPAHRQEAFWDYVVWTEKKE